MTTTSRFFGILTLILGGTISAPCAPVFIGTLSYSTLIPGVPGAPGVSHFAIENFTGVAALPSDFPVVEDVLFADATLLVNSEIAPQKFTLGDVGPGFFSLTELQFPDNTLIFLAVFEARLTQTTFDLASGESVVSSSANIQATLRPSRGAYLVPDEEIALIAINAIPEPVSFALSAFGLLVFVAWQRLTRPSSIA